MDFQALLFNPAHDLLGVDAKLVVNGTAYTVRVLDKTTGVDTGVSVRGQTILPAAIVRVSKLKALGLRPTDLGSSTTYLSLNGSWWSVVTYRLRPSPNGEADGEVYLVLDRNGVPAGVTALPADQTARNFDFQALLLDPAHAVFAVDAILELQNDFFNIRAIDKTSGVDVGVEVKGQTILPAAVIRAREYLNLGLAYERLGHKNSYFKINGVFYRIITYRMKPSPYGEDDGEIYLLLTKLPVLDAVLLPPGIFLDDTVLDVPYITTDLGVTIGSPISDGAVLDATITLTVDLSAVIADDLGLIPVPVIGTDLIATITDEGTFSASAPEIGIRLSAIITDDSAFAITITDDMRAGLADDTGISTAVMFVGSTISAAFADDTGLSSALLVTSSLIATLIDDFALAETMTIVDPVVLAASIADDTGLGGTISIVWPPLALSASIADDTGLASTISAGWFLNAAVVDDLGLAATLLATTSLTAIVKDDFGIPTSTVTITSNAPDLNAATPVNTQSVASSSFAVNSPNFTTTPAVVVLVVARRHASVNSNTTVTATGATFTRKRSLNMNFSTQDILEIYTAPGWSGIKSITIGNLNTPDDTYVQIYGVDGAHLTSGVSNTDGGGIASSSTTASLTFSTTSAADFVSGAQFIRSNSNPTSPPTGYTRIGTIVSGGAGNPVGSLDVFYKRTTNAIASETVSATLASGGFGEMIAIEALN